MKKSKLLLLHHLALPAAVVLLQLAGGAQLAAAQSKNPTGQPPAAANPASKPAAAATVGATPPAPAEKPAIDAAAQPKSQDSCLGNAEASPANPKLARVQGVVLAPNEQPPGIVLTLKNKKTSDRLIVNRLESCKEEDGKSGGRFVYAIEVQPGTYEVSLSGPDYRGEAVVPLALAAKEVRRLDFALKKKGFDFAFLLPLLYILSILFVRWNNIAKPSRVGVIAQLQDLKGQFPKDDIFTQELKGAQDNLQRRATTWEWLFWSRGLEMTCWNLVHKAEIALIKGISLAEINARLATAQQHLLEIDKSAAKSLAGRIDEELKQQNGVDSETKRQLLTEATSYIYDYKDTEYASLTSWQNKAFWLTLVGVILIWAVATSMGHVFLFIAGAVGGFLSRLNRQLKRADVPTDYGASWSTLFLSPVAGAISGWFGVALIVWLHHLQVLGQLIDIDWNDATSAATLAAAFVLGFSERLFDGLVSQLEETIDKKKADAQKTPLTKPPAQPSADASGTPGIKPLGIPSVKPGGTVTAQLDNLDAAKVTGVSLKSAAAGDKPEVIVQAENAQKGTGAITFTVPKDTQTERSYQIILLTAGSTPPQIETGQKLTVTAG